MQTRRQRGDGGVKIEGEGGGEVKVEKDSLAPGLPYSITKKAEEDMMDDVKVMILLGDKKRKRKRKEEERKIRARWGGGEGGRRGGESFAPASFGGATADRHRHRHRHSLGSACPTPVLAPSATLCLLPLSTGRHGLLRAGGFLGSQLSQVIPQPQPQPY